MPFRTQNVRVGLGSAKQTNISTISSTFNTWRKLNADIPFNLANTETDKDEFGKGTEFISATGVFKTNKEPGGNTINKYGSAEWLLWSWAYAMGGVPAPVGGLYTIDALDPATGIESLYFSIVSQGAEGGGTAFDEALIGNSVESVETRIHYGPGRASVQCNVEYIGSGIETIPSGVVLPATLAETNLLGSSAAISINGIDYVAGTPGSKTALMANITWRNNHILPMRYVLGSGLDADGFQTGARNFFGSRVPGIGFTALMTKDSDEYAKLVAQTTGTAVITLTYDGTHFVTFTFHLVSFERVERTTEEGLVAVTTMIAPREHVTNGVLTVTGKCSLADIGQ